MVDTINIDNIQNYLIGKIKTGHGNQITHYDFDVYIPQAIQGYVRDMTGEIQDVPAAARHYKSAGIQWVVVEDDKVTLAGLDYLSPGKTVNATLHHSDESEEYIALKHSLTAEQIRWFQAGSALNLIKEKFVTSA